MSYKIIKRCCFFLPLILWMILIFSFSHQPAVESSEISGGITQTIIGVIEKVSSIDMDYEMLEHYIRKCGHFVEYMILGIFMFIAFYKNKLFDNHMILSCIIFCALYATSDEVHQIFVPGRGPRVFDVMIDSAGSYVGILIANILLPNPSQDILLK